ncbi:N-glycosylase/DNA lyase [Caldicoprobacter guelmensis]|uniref:DNA-3-methyladenine glycosylase family protein n=1 Tax=Caldicoprobacter guelmensis TaxID=1170224 RepID=UPI00195D988D|nr:DNA glycosylase [Caldicoprobacter guelmensis]MBM7582132.1 N-glycosylase/DNA lyase [Caldicoprobacter guelmensis]
MEIVQTSRGIILKGVDDFFPQHIFECGQAFRWNWDGIGYVGIAGGRVIRVSYDRGNVSLENVSVRDYHSFWKRYFDMDRDYGQVKAALSRDPLLEKAMEYGWGIRILNQDPWETLISFIISANNNIPRIKRTIENLAVRFGKRIEWKGRDFYTFPMPADLAGASVEELVACGCGYRAQYIKRTAEMVCGGEIRLDKIAGLPYKEAHKALMACPGVGPKVADCVLLFSMGKTEAFPVDVWIKKVMQRFYPDSTGNNRGVKELAWQKFGQLAGFAQQYLFYYARECMM